MNSGIELVNKIFGAILFVIFVSLIVFIRDKISISIISVWILFLYDKIFDDFSRAEINNLHNKNFFDIFWLFLRRIKLFLVGIVISYWAIIYL